MKHLLLFLIAGYLGLYHGNLALWQENRTEPDEVFPYCVQMYPKADQIALKKGIPYQTEDELNRLLEDFLS